MDKIAAGIILYNPDIDRLEKNISAILPQVGVLTIVDNGSRNYKQVYDKFSIYEKIIFIKNNENLGIATALNQLCSWAYDMKYDWVMTLDQDSICPDNIIAEFRKHTNKEEIGIICPGFTMDIYEKEKKTATRKNDKEFIDVCITSGSLTSIKAWKDVKGFDDWMFIDCVDYDFCMRLKRHGYKILRINTIMLNHQVGNAVRKKFLNKYITLYFHTEERNYYFVRNYIYYIRKYHKDINVFKRIVYLLYWEGMKLIFETRRLKTMRSAIKGFVDGCKVKID